MKKEGLLQIGFTVLAGSGTALGIVFPIFWFLVPLGLGLFFYTLWCRARTRQDACTIGGLFGILTAGAGLWWLFAMIPLTMTPPTIAEYVVVGILWLLPTLALALVSAVIAIPLFIIRANFLAPIGAVCLLLIHEELRMWMWTFVTWGQGSTFTPHFSITALGYALAENPYLLQIAEGGGLAYLTATTAIIASAVACVILWCEKKIPQSTVLIALTLLISVCIIPLSKSSLLKTNDTLHVVVFSTTHELNLPQQDTSLLFETLMGTTSPDVVLLPEGIQLDSLFSSEETEHLNKKWSEQDVLFIHSVSPESMTNHNVLTYDSSTRGTLGIQEKILLMPQGEYQPYISQALFFPFQNNIFNKLSSGGVRVPGNQLKAVSYKGNTIGALLCSEVLSPYLYRTLVTEKGANLLANLGNPVWFHGSTLLHAKTQTVAKVHAVQNRTYFLAAQNGTPSYIIDPKGKIVAETRWKTTDALFFSISPK